MVRSVRLLGPAMIALVLALVLFIWTANGHNTTRQTVPSPLSSRVTREDVDQQRKGTPQRALMAWWHSMQYGDAQGYRLLAPDIRQQWTRRKYWEDVGFALGGGFPGKPKIEHVQRESKSRAAVDVLITFSTENNQRLIVPRTFRFRRVAGRWLVASLDYLRAKALEGRHSAEAVRHAQNDGP